MFTILDNIRIYIIAILFIFIGISCSENPFVNQDTPQNDFTENDLNITEIVTGNANTAGKYRMITFGIQWRNSWRQSSSSNNWDAAWVFIKYKVGMEGWKHATLSTVSTEHSAPSGSIITPPSDGKGVFIYGSGNGTDTLNASGVSIRWNYGQDNVSDDAIVDVKVFGIEMVYIPQGSFYVGDNGASDASLTKGSNDNRPWHITSEDAVHVTNTESNGYYYRSSKDIWSEVWNASEDLTGTEFTIPAEYPKGYNAIYCMKYEMSEQQYVDFLNTLNSSQVANRYDGANYNHFGYTISQSNGVFSTDHPKRACGFLSPADSYAYADWCGLRPMTELEFEKICRGSENQVVELEFAWGTTYSKNATAVTGTESDREYLTSTGANSYFLQDNFQGQFPLNTGIFAGPGKSREKSGAAYYGVMEMSTNLSELCVSIGNEFGRLFTYQNGDGRLGDDGYANEINWPLRDGRGGGYRGGCFANEQLHMCTSVRVEAAVEINYSHRHIPWGFRGVRTVSF